MSNLTIVFQGRYSSEILSFSKRVKEQFPNIPIIVSCWDGDSPSIPTELYDYAQLVFSADPGAIQVPKHKLDNVSRQLASTQAGLEQVRTLYVLKLRSDITVDMRKIVDLMQLCTAVADSESKIFERKVLVTSLTTLDPVRSGHYFHVCDWVYLGLTADVRALFASASLPDVDHFRYFEANDELELASRYRPEAYILYSLVKQRGMCVDYSFSGEVSEDIQRKSADVLRQNFVVLNPWNMGLASEKHKNLHLWLVSDRYSEINCGSYLRSLPFAQRQAAKVLDHVARFMTTAAISGAKIKQAFKGRV